MSLACRSWGSSPSSAASTSPRPSRSSGGDEVQLERVEQLVLVRRVDAVSAPILAAEQAVFVQVQISRQGPGAHGDVVVLAAGEVMEHGGVVLVGYQAQVDLDAALEANGGLALALGQYVDDLGQGGEGLGHVHG